MYRFTFGDYLISFSNCTTSWCTHSLVMEVRENKGPILLAVAIGCYALAFIGTAARIYVRRYLVGLLGLDDWLIVASLVCSMI